MRERAGKCNALVASGATMNDAELALELVPPLYDCPATTPDPPPNSVCAPGPVCRFFFLYIASDPGLCGSGIGQGCDYVCEAWTTQADGALFLGGDNLVPICASQWFSKVQLCVPGQGCF